MSIIIYKKTFKKYVARLYFMRAEQPHTMWGLCLSFYFLRPGIFQTTPTRTSGCPSAVSTYRLVRRQSCLNCFCIFDCRRIRVGVLRGSYYDTPPKGHWPLVKILIFCREVLTIYTYGCIM